MPNISASNSTELYAPNYPSSFPYIHGVSFEETSSSTVNNTSNVKVTAYIRSTGASFASTYDSDGLSVYWYDDNENSNGKRVKLNSTIYSLGKNAEISVTGTISVAHKSNGKVSGYAWSKWTKDDNNNYTPPTNTIKTETTALTNIIRGSSISVDKSSILCGGGEGLTINISKPVASYTDTITYKLGNVTGTVIEKTPATVVSAWTVPTSVLDGMPNSQTGTLTLTCQTYNGDTPMGSSSTTVLVTTSQELHGPTLSITAIVDLNASDVYGSRTLADIEGGSYISGLSHLRLTLSAEARYGASRKRTETTLNGVTVGGTLTPEFDGDLGNGTFTITTRDSRGYVTEIHPSVNVIRYFPPAIVRAVADRDDSEVTDVRGITAGTWYNGTLGNMNNELTVTARYNNPSPGVTPASGDNTLTVDLVGNTWSFNGIVFSNLSQQTAGTVQFIFSDLITTVSSIVIPIYEYLPVFAMFQDHFDVFGTLHIHDRTDPNRFSVLPYDYYAYHAGDTVTFTDNIAMFPGVVTSGGDVIAFSIALPKMTSTAIIATVTGTVIIRHADGNYISANDGRSSQPVDIDLLGTVTSSCDANYVRVRIQLTTTTALTNNSVVVVTPGTSLTVTFSTAP